jgi:glycosyltransferase involved in cell wall biosynthesis
MIRMATLAFFQNRLGRTDGVSLEVDKWRTVLRDRMGHTVWYCSGNNDVPTNYNIPELYAQHPKTWKILRNGTVEFRDYATEQDLELDIYNHADVLEEKLLRFIEEKKVNVLLPNNLCSGGYQPAAAIAFHRVMRKTGLPSFIHSHDFYFEESGEVRATCHTVASIYERYFPVKLPNVRHVVINRIAQGELKRRKNLNATVVPNVFDFDQPPWVADEYNSDFRAAFGIGRDDLVFLQATRILDRKGIELAIDVVAEVGKSARRRALAGAPTAGGGRFGKGAAIVLLCAGIVETIGISGDYWGALHRRAKALGVDLRHVGDRVKHSRGAESNGAKIYSLWDSYVLADFVTYPSTWEGWGNQFIEAVFAKLPVLLFEYPVWVSDLKEAGFDVVSLGDTIKGRDEDGLASVSGAKVRAAADQIVAILTDPSRKREIGEKNFAIGRERYSLGTLERIIRGLLGDAGIV